jgi:hypothetical protein
MGSSQSHATGSEGASLGQRAASGLHYASAAAAAAPDSLNRLAGHIAATTAAAQGVAAAAGPAVNALTLAMKQMQLQSPGVTGGCGCGGFFGGATDADPTRDLREYEASLSAKAKEDVIRRLARALTRAGLSVDPEGDLDEIVKQLVAQIPNPRKGTKSFKVNADAQEKVCRLVADVLNDEFTPGVTKPGEKFIDTSLGVVEMCRAVGEWVHSFASGVNTEFLAVHASVKNALREIAILDQVMAEAHSAVTRKIEESHDERLGRETDSFIALYTRAQNERRRVEELLKNILHVQLAPAAKELEIAMRDESEENALIKRLGLKPGTSEFADTLAMAVSGLGTAASVAQRVHKALKQVGMSVRDYLASPEFADFQRALDAKVESRSIPPEDLARFLEAAETLRSSFGERKEPRFRAALEETAGASGGARSARRARHGGADDDDKSTVVKRAERQETEKKVIVRDFAARMARHYDELLSAVKAMGPKLGKEIPLTEKTDGLRDALGRLRDMRAERIELSLIGLYMDASARAKKEQFVSALRLVASSCSSIMELEMYRGVSSYFARLKAAVDGIEKSIDYFADVVAKKYGGREIGDEELEEYVEGGSKRGGDDSILPEIARSSLSLNEAVSEFSYFYYVAKVRANLEQTSKELDSYSEKYTELLGDAVAARLYALEQERTAILARLTAAAPFAAGAAGDPERSKAKEWVEDEYKIKGRFYRALQAMDLYLKAFTAGIVKDPDAVRNIKAMLDGTQVIARWFSDQTGDFLWKAFEEMPSTDYAGAKRPPGAAMVAALGAANNDHYYQRVAAGGAADVGVPELGVNPVAAEKAKRNVSETLEYYQGLKNLVNAFARIGDKFGGRELRTQVFMSPAQIYKALVDYLKQSALSIHAGDKVTPPVPLAVTVAGAAVANGVDPYQVFFGGVGAVPQGSYVVEDRYFELIVKAMAAKVLTTLGVYDMFERTSPVYDLTPTRMIIGGAFDTEPEVLDGAAELYFRLTRLAEFYRMFKWDGEGGVNFKIAMLPELEGVFSGLIRLIFQKVASPESGDYSDSELRALIREENAIFLHFREKHGDQACQAALSAFVMEVNRRYGVIKADDMKAYWKMVRLARTGEPGRVNDTDYAILPGEEDTEVDRRAPSDRFATGQYARYDPATGRPINPATGLPHEPFANLDRNLDTEWHADGGRQMLRNFRRSIEDEFRQVGRADFRATSYSLLIKQARAEIARASSPEAKLAVAFKLIQGTSVVSTDANKAYMFHETVVVGLNTLSVVEAMVRNFSDLVDQMNPATIEGEIMDRIAASAAAGTVRANFSLATLNALLATAYGDALPARAVGTYDRYLIDLAAAGAGAGSFLERSGLAYNVTGADLDTFMTAEYAAMLLAPADIPARPSQYKDELAPARVAAAQLRYLRTLRIFARFVVNYTQIMRDYVENLYDLTGSLQGLVEVRFLSGSGVQLGFSKLRGTAESLLSDVKYFLDIFRPFMPKATIERFEDRANPGSVYWLEEHLVDRFFRGSFSGAVEAQLAGDRATLEGLGRRTADVLKQLTRSTAVSTDVLTHAALTGAAGTVDAAIGGIANWPDAAPESRREDFGRAFSGLVFYDAVDFTSGLGGAGAPALLPLPGDASVTGFDLSSLFLTARGPAPGGPAPLPTAAGGAALQRWDLYSSAGPQPHRSLLFSFNQLLARYLATLVDTAGGQKVYLNLINSLANGVMSLAVGAPPGNTWPDLAAAGQPFGLRGDPSPTAPLFQSLAYVLERLMRDVAPPLNQVPDHLVTTLTDVPLYMKERFRANLPGFVKLFDLLSQKCDFVKQFIQKSGASIARPSLISIATTGGAAAIAAGSRLATAAGTAAVVNNYQAGSLGGLLPLDGALDDVAMKTRLASIIDSIAGGAYTLSSAAGEVLKELGDSPVYFQTQEGSIDSYKMRYGKLPIMPISLSFWFLSGLRVNNGFVVDDRLYPRHTLGSPEFKMLYGHRALLARGGPVGFDQIPSVKASLDAYNGVSGTRERIDEKRYLEFVQNAVGVLRYTVDCRNYKSLLCSVSRLFCSGPVVNGANDGIRNFVAPNQGSALFSLNEPAKEARDILNIVEDSNQDEEAEKITAVVGGGGLAGPAARGNRGLERVLNLIDMNIVPVNVHALMRDIPLAGLYNYEYTFEQMIAALYGEQAAAYTAMGGLDDAHTHSTRQMLLRLLVDPFVDLTPAMYGSDAMDLGTGGFVHRIFRGDNDLGMGRPKFLSDQVFNKALFGSVYQSRTDFDEGGPGVGAGVSRGLADGIGAGPVSRAFRGYGPELQAIVAGAAADLAAFQGPAAAGAATLVGAVAAAGAAAAPAIRDRTYDWITTIARPHLRRWGEVATRVAAGVAAFAGVPADVDPIRDRLTLAGAGVPALLAAIDALGADKATRIAAAGFDAAVDALMAEFNIANAGTFPVLARRALAQNRAFATAAAQELLAAGPRRLPGNPAAQWGPQYGARASKLTFLKAADAGAAPETAVTEVAIPAGAKARLEAVGKLRFDTRFVRKLFFITNVVRLLRLKLNRELTQSRSILVSSHMAVASGITEFGTDPFGPNEVLGSSLPGGVSRYNDRDTF